jgi:protein-disulfide isomerase
VVDPPGPPSRGGRALRARWWILLGVAALAVVGVLVGLSLSGGGGGSSSETGSQLAGAAQANGEFAGLPQDGARVGRASAPVSITEYADLQCPFCAELALETIPSVLDRWVRPGTASLTFRTFSIIGPDSTTGARGAQAAALQDRLWPFVDLVYRNQGGENDGWLTNAFMVRVARQVRGIDVTRFTDDLDSQAVEAAVEADQAAGDREVQATPQLVITGPRGTRALEGFQTPAAIDATVESVR